MGMNQNINISIKTPCSEKFENFKSTNNGGYCNSCQKEVVDFTKMPEADILNYFKKEKNTTCGYFHKSQLRTYSSDSLSYNKKKNRLFGLVSFSLLSLLSTNDSWGQKVQMKTKTHVSPEVKENVKEKFNDDLQGLISGIVLDESGQPMPGASITLKKTDINASTNFDGEFTFPRKLKKGDILVVSYIGMETFEYKISGKKAIINLKFTSCDLLGEVSVNEVYKTKSSFFARLKRIFND